MIPVHYSYRAGLFSRERSFWLESDALGWARGEEEGRILYRDVDQVRLYRSFMRGGAAIEKKLMWRMHLHCRSGERIDVSPLHYAGFRRWEDRSAGYVNFANQLLGRLRALDPALKTVAAHHWTMRLRQYGRDTMAAVGGAVLLQLHRLVRRCDPDRTSKGAAGLMRAAGPWLRGHRVARRNLAGAFPDKSEAEIASILEGMWDNFGRAIAEYAFLDRLWDFDPKRPDRGRISIDPIVLDRVARIRTTGKPVLWFGAHLGNWEMPGVAITALGLKLAVVYRAPDFVPIAKEIGAIRTRVMGNLIATAPGAARRIKTALDHGTSVGMLVDQHFAGGADVVFFGRACKVNPTLARFARRTECAIHGARFIRLPTRRFRLELTDALAPPRDREGKIDVPGTMQMITSTIETWVREDPEQWLWMHRRWR